MFDYFFLQGTIMGGSPFTGRKADHILSQSHQSILNKGSLHAWNKKADKFQNRYSTDDMAFEKDNEMSQVQFGLSPDLSCNNLGMHVKVLYLYEMSPSEIPKQDFWIQHSIW